MHQYKRLSYVLNNALRLSGDCDKCATFSTKLYTLQAYFEGRKELFEGLKIMDLEKEWVKRPVVRLDMSRAGSTAHELNAYLNLAFKEYEQKYGIEASASDSLSNRLDIIIQSAYEQTGQQVAILIDEYDSPLQHSWKTPHHEDCLALHHRGRPGGLADSQTMAHVVQREDYDDAFVVYRRYHHPARHHRAFRHHQLLQGGE